MIPKSIRTETIESIMSPLLDGAPVRVVRISPRPDQDAVDAAVAGALAVVERLPATLQPSVRRALRRALDFSAYAVRRDAREDRFETAERALFKRERAA